MSLADDEAPIGQPEDRLRIDAGGVQAQHLPFRPESPGSLCCGERIRQAGDGPSATILDRDDAGHTRPAIRDRDQ